MEAAVRELEICETESVSGGRDGGTSNNVGGVTTGTTTGTRSTSGGQGSRTVTSSFTARNGLAGTLVETYNIGPQTVCTYSTPVGSFTSIIGRGACPDVLAPPRSWPR